MLDSLCCIQEKSYELAREKWSEAIKELEKAVAKSSFQFALDESSTSDSDDDYGDKEETPIKKSKEQDKLMTLQSSFEHYLRQLPIVSFNGGKYDIPLLRKYLLPTLKSRREEPDEDISVIKKSQTPTPA